MTTRDERAIRVLQTLLKDTDSSRILTEADDYLLKNMIKASYKVADAIQNFREEEMGTK